VSTEAAPHQAVAEVKAGLLDRAIFSSEAIYQQELERIFARCWLFLGHTSQLPRPHDFVTSYMGEDPILLWRDGAGTVRAFLNMCRHRGNRLCRADAGNAASFMCTYHGWNYTADGKLASVPGQREVYGGGYDLERWGLVEVAQLDIYKGLIFATFDRTAPPLVDYLGDQRPLLDVMLDRRSGGTEVLGGVHRWILKTNWKYPADNFGGDDGHHLITHASVRKVPVDAVDYANNVRDQYNVNTHVRAVAAAPAAGEGPRMEAALAAVPPGVLRDYTRAHFAEAHARLGADAYRENIIETVFPNFSFNLGRHMLRVWHPRGPGTTEMWSFCLVDAQAPAEVKDALRQHLIQTFGPAGNFEQDDILNWQQCTETARGAVARRYPQNIQAGLTDDPAADIGRKLGTRLRDLYTRWAVMMEAADWSAVALDRHDWT
jgi:phenylpropionate dioxygenase-like ring-hydroxylating dioxygenase large terminal subunit